MTIKLFMNIKVLSCLAFAFFSFSTSSNELIPIPANQQAGVQSGFNSPSPNTQLPVGEEDLPPPYGANLFTGAFEAERSDGLNEDYIVAAGDKISIWIWGAVSHADIATVDNQGNIFIPEVGPIKVSDVPATEVNDVVAQKIRSVYTNNVNVYVNLLNATPVSVFVTGPVLRPGQYAGLASDSVLFYLNRTGGIDAERGSYRKVTVVRNGKAIQHIDLYDFLRNGVLPQITFKDNDVILVGEQGPTVTVEGGARYPFRFELLDEVSLGKRLIDYARPMAKISHVAVAGNRESGPVSVYLPYKQFEAYELKDGDTVTFNDDLRPQVVDVQITGSYLGPSFYTVNKDARLLELLDYISVDTDLADIKSIYIQRESVALKQKELIEESLRRLERSVFTAPASSDGEAVIRQKEAELVVQFVERARQIEPLGKVILASDGKVANIRLEQGDRIIIPAQNDLIQVAGEVLMPQAVVFNENAVLLDYVAWAGGFTERADVDRIAVVHANGMIDFSPQQTLVAGDQILVMPKVEAKTMQAVKDITQIIYQIAVAANVVLRD
ncbi:polysaccharide biosynthesis/export family protein [Agarivorans sp. B2Z047]|uniref:polysaccharide biosynthesis/export family protein n=1 Tax=Agarivorans sp. B2Z047 TaxID=2652721 RepID=UPI00201A2125|nr:polysaccharide biosynthesis/export family protein [Agarivorans sp. B2Z047]UQN41315.1 polysaccharide export protein [Agarivorans sp. B2Z047]